MSRGIDGHRLLRGTGLFYADVAEGRAKLSPEQTVTLIENAQRRSAGATCAVPLAMLWRSTGPAGSSILRVQKSPDDGALRAFRRSLRVLETIQVVRTERLELSP